MSKSLGVYMALALTMNKSNEIHSLSVIPHMPERKQKSDPTLDECIENFKKQLGESNAKMWMIHDYKAATYSYHNLLPSGESFTVVGKNQKTVTKILNKLLAQNGLRIQEVKPEVESNPVEPKKSVHGELKGMYGGLCNRTACQSPSNVIYYNYSTRKFYCPECALLINRDNKVDATRLYGHDLCLPMSKDEAAKANTN